MEVYKNNNYIENYFTQPRIAEEREGEKVKKDERTFALDGSRRKSTRMTSP